MEEHEFTNFEFSEAATYISDDIKREGFTDEELNSVPGQYDPDE